MIELIFGLKNWLWQLKMANFWLPHLQLKYLIRNQKMFWQCSFECKSLSNLNWYTMELHDRNHAKNQKVTYRSNFLSITFEFLISWTLNFLQHSTCSLIVSTFKYWLKVNFTILTRRSSFRCCLSSYKVCLCNGLEVRFSQNWGICMQPIR